MTMYNIINGKAVFPAGIFNLREHTSQRHYSSLYNRLYTRTNYLYFSFVPNVVSLWNIYIAPSLKIIIYSWSL